MRDKQGRDANKRYFAIEDNELRLRLRLPVMPSLLTANETVIRQE